MIDAAPFASNLATWVLLLVVFVAIKTFLKSPRIKGKIGEKVVATAGRAALDPGEYIQVHDLLLRDTDGSTTQIDHVILSPYGIFVIETKHYKGWIFGSERNAKWTQKVYRKTHTFQNPLRQNYRHIKVLSKLLGIDEDKFVSIVVFSGECTFKTPMPPNVVKGRGYISHILSHKTPIIPIETVRAAANTLCEIDLSDQAAAQKEHVATTKQNHTATASANDRMCPKCGGKMVLRENRKTGQKFWGCSNFPKCRKTLPA